MVDLPAVQEIASLPLAGLGMWFMYKLASNHLSHNTTAIERLVDTLSESQRTDIEFQGWLKGYISREEEEKNAKLQAEETLSA